VLFAKRNKIASFASLTSPAAGRIRLGVVLWLMSRAAAAVVALVCLAVPPAMAYSYSDFNVFGDSLSDVGNVYIATGGTLPAGPYVDGQFSNGPVWAQVLSNSLGLGALQSSLAGGTDFAFGGATTGNPSTASATAPTLTEQIGMFLASVGGNAPSSALYAVWIGGDDLFNILSSDVDPPVALAQAQAAAQSEAGDIGALIAQGARDILVPLVPDLGLTPVVTAAGAGAAATLLAQAYNAALVAAIGDLGPVPGLRITYLDTFSLTDAVVADPGAFGFTNVTDPCYVGPYTGGGSVCADPNLYLFWDANHPSAAAHARFAAAARIALVPEPGALSLLVAGLGGLAFVLRRAPRQGGRGKRGKRLRA
jgi:phospholipase/lecithinase/hemolysin